MFPKRTHTFPSLVISALLGGLMLPNPSYAATSGWLNGPQLQRYMKSVDASGGLPTSIRCQLASKGKGSVLFKITTNNNKQRRAWQWLWADNASFRKSNQTFSKAGFKLVSHETLRAGRAQSKFDCGIWHR